jgi:lysophospholipase L1-like esterase
MSTKENGRLQTYPHLKAVVQGISEAALENGAAFWNMFEVMGGENSMIEWVNNKPAWAAPDYIHFSQKGADRIAELFYESLMIYYNYAQFTANYKPQ